MNQTTFFGRLRPHLLFVLGFFVLASLYFIPAFQGKELPMQDIRQSYASTIELREFKKQTGEFPLWTNALFSGMPAYMIAFDYPYTFVGRSVDFVLNLIPRPVNLLFVTMLSMYLLLLVIARTKPDEDGNASARRWLAATGAVAYAFGTYLLLAVEAGHVSKVWAMAYAPGVLAGVILALRGRYLIGAAITAFFACMELNANHLQITYYLFLTIGIYVLMEAIALIRAGKTKQLGMGLAVLALAGGLGTASFSKRLLVLNQYQKETIRGRSELTGKTTAQANRSTADTTVAQTAPTATSQDGLDKDYAFNWSYGKAEALNLLVPNLFGGGSGGGLDTDSEMYKALLGKGVDPAAALQFVQLGAPTYWGDQPGVGGPSYAGAVLLFLFVLGLTLSQNRIRWFLLAGALLMLAIAMGKNLLLINGPLFDYLPLFNKFRAVTMTMGLVPFFLAGGAVLGVLAIIDRNLTFEQIKRPLAISFGLTGGLALVLALLGSTFFSFTTASDVPMLAQYFGEQGANEMLRALVSDRQSMARADAFRSFVFIALAAGAIYLFVTKRVKPVVFFPVLLVLMIADLFMVDKRFLNNQNFIPKTQVNSAFEETPADASIRTDKSLSYRVWDQTGSFMNDNRTSFFHKSIGGYHAAKLRRYQELIEYAFPKNTLNILNMLNGKYAILQPQPDPNNPQQAPTPMAQANPEALGNAWFVNTLILVPDADTEISWMQKLNPRDSVVVDKRFSDQLKGLSVMDPTGASISLIKYIPDHLTYESNSPKEQLAVFSEVYYRGDTDWNAYVDGKKVPHMRANYVLRAMRVPAGKHTIEFKFEPPVVALGDTLDLIANGLLVLFIAGAIFLNSRRKALA
jgi:hypothetical protein